VQVARLSNWTGGRVEFFRPSGNQAGIDTTVTA